MGLDNCNSKPELNIDENMKPKFLSDISDYSMYENFNDNEQLLNNFKPNNHFYNLSEKSHKNEPEEPEKNQLSYNNIDGIEQTYNLNNTDTRNETGNNKRNLKGRKRKRDTDDKQHTKHDEDNKIKKIKAYFNTFVTEQINSSLSLGHKKLLKMNKEINENLNIQFNIDLMGTTLKKLFAYNSNNKKYSRPERIKDYNIKLIEEIYSKEIEKKAIQILDMTYYKYFVIMRTQYFDQFKNEKLRKEKKLFEKEEDAKKYVDDLAKLLFEFEHWFSNRTPRKSKNKNTEI